VASYHVHVCKFVPVVRSIQGRIFVRPIHSSSAVRFNMTTFFAVRSMGHSGPSTISLHGEIYGKSQWRLQGAEQRRRLQGARHRWLRGHYRLWQSFSAPVHHFQVNLRLTSCLFLGGIVLRFP
jgi:hypothetical protein